MTSSSSENCRFGGDFRWCEGNFREIVQIQPRFFGSLSIPWTAFGAIVNGRWKGPMSVGSVEMTVGCVRMTVEPLRYNFIWKSKYCSRRTFYKSNTCKIEQLFIFKIFDNPFVVWNEWKQMVFECFRGNKNYSGLHWLMVDWFWCLWIFVWFLCDFCEPWLELNGSSMKWVQPQFYSLTP